MKPPQLRPTIRVATWPAFAWTVTMALGRAGALAPDATVVKETAVATVAKATVATATIFRDTDIPLTSFSCL
jgi:hypothetical protein